MKRFITALLLVVSLAVVGGNPAGAADAGVAVRVSGLTVEHRADPLGVDVARPLLGWIVAPPVTPTAYRIEVSTTRNGRADVWDSGRVASARSFDVEYGGPALASRTRYFWRVRVWAGARQAWSRRAWFETAFLRPAEFRGDWIGAHRAAPALSLAGASWIWHPDGDPADAVPAGTRYFRRTFDLPAAVGELQITADDAFTVHVNGIEMARSPAVADAWRTGVIVDLAPALRAGRNVIAVAATNTSLIFEHDRGGR